MNCVKHLTLLLLVCIFCVCANAFAEETNSGAKSVQEQINDLRKMQDQILQQLDEIKALLKQSPAVETKPTYLSINVHGEPFRGNTNAPLAILQYSDFDCPYCADFATNTLPKITAQYVNTGKVKLLFRDMPMPEHPNAPFKAKVARCAGEQGKFWQMHDYLYAHQQPMNEADLPSLAKAVGIDLNTFAACLGANKYDAVIQRSVLSADRLHIDGTPAFLIGTLSADGSFLKADRVTLGDQSYEFFQAKLNELLDIVEKPSASPK